MYTFMCIGSCMLTHTFLWFSYNLPFADDILCSEYNYDFVTQFFWLYWDEMYMSLFRNFLDHLLYIPRTVAMKYHRGWKYLLSQNLTLPSSMCRILFFFWDHSPWLKMTSLDHIATHSSLHPSVFRWIFLESIPARLD